MNSKKEGSHEAQEFGANGDVPVVADYDGDGKTDLAVFRLNVPVSEEGTWYILNSSDSSLRAQQWGLSTDKLVPADYDGDGKTDFAVWRATSGNWYILKSSIGHTSFGAPQWGLSGDVPVPGNYDGDNKTDVAVFRPSIGNCYILRSSDGSLLALQWGTERRSACASSLYPITR